MNNHGMTRNESAYYDFIIYIVSNNLKQNISWSDHQERLFGILSNARFMMKENNITFAYYLRLHNVNRIYIVECMRYLIEMILNYNIGVKSDFTGRKAKRIRRVTAECKAVLNDNN